MTSQQALQFVEANLDIEKLISQVHERPSLWDMAQKDHSDRVKRKQCWDEITELFSSGKDLSLDDKIQLGDILHKKWENIRDRFTRDIQERKGESGDEARKKVPYMYSRQLEFLRDTVLDRTSVESASVDEEREEEHEDTEEEDEIQEATSASSTRSSTPNVLRTHVRQPGKTTLHPVEEKILHSLDMYGKRAKRDKEKKRVEDNDNRHFSLSLVQSLASLPPHLKTSCKIEIMECIENYKIMSREHQQPLTYLPTTHSYPFYQHYNTQQQHRLQQLHHLQPTHHTQMYVPNQMQLSSSYTSSNEQRAESQRYPPETFVTPRPTSSPDESDASYMSNFTDENDSQSSDL